MKHFGVAFGYEMCYINTFALPREKENSTQLHFALETLYLFVENLPVHFVYPLGMFIFYFQYKPIQVSTTPSHILYIYFYDMYVCVCETKKQNHLWPEGEDQMPQRDNGLGLLKSNLEIKDFWQG